MGLPGLHRLHDFIVARHRLAFFVGPAFWFHRLHIPLAMELDIQQAYFYPLSVSWKGTLPEK